MSSRDEGGLRTEFGKSGSGSATAGMDGPTMGAAATILVDGIVERESGRTPGPPPVRLKTVIIGLVAMFLLGVGVALLLAGRGPITDGEAVRDEILESVRGR